MPAGLSSPLHVLIVEDSDTDAKLVARALRAIGRPIAQERVEDEPGMRAALERSRWDVIVCDWSLPRFDALAALRVLRESRLDVPLIIVSGTIGEETAVEGMRAGAQDYVLKHALTRLAPAVERELRARQLREAAHLGPVDLDALAARLLPAIQRILGEGITAAAAPGEGEGVVEADPHRLERLLLDLPVRLRGAVPSGARLTLETSSDPAADPVVVFSLRLHLKRFGA